MKVWEKERLLSQMYELCQLLYVSKHMDQNFLVELQSRIILCGTECESFHGTENIIKSLENAAEYCYLSVKEGYKRYKNKILHEIDYAKSILGNINADKMEILFLPYKASMWDSMKSVYMSALLSNDCKVYVMPILYYDKGSLGEEKCEQAYFERLEGYVEYKSYDISEHKPDVIFIHNPYDQFNKETTVKECYYSSKLMNSTSHIVYIPYDIVKEDELNEFMCVMPGIRNAWRVFVQSEKIRKKYLKYSVKDNIIAAGTPKLDFLSNNRKVTLPEEWKYRIRDKKVVLFNIHLVRTTGNILGEVEMICKVMDYFSINDMVLLYRPHPLFEEILKNKSVDGYIKYKQALEKYDGSLNIIIDKTEEIEQAITICDACIGDRGSLEMFFGVCGKPMYFMNSETIEFSFNEKWQKLACYRIAVDKDVIWFFVNSRYNLLCKYNLVDKVCTCLIYIGEETAKQNLVDSVVKRGNKIILIPAESEFLRIYNIEDHSIQKFKLKYKDSSGYKYQKGICLDSKEVYLTPISGSVNKILKINTEEDVIKEIKIDSPILSEKRIFEQKFALGCGIVNEECVYLPILHKPYMLKCCDGGTEYYKIGSYDDGFTCCVYDGTYFWLAYSRCHALIRWNEKDGEYVLLDQFPEGFAAESEPLFNQIVLIQNDLWLIPYGANMILKINIQSLEICQVKCDNVRVHKLLQEEVVFESAELADDRLYMVPADYNVVVFVDLKTEKIYWEQITTPQNKNFMSSILPNLVDKEYNCNSSDVSLQDFCEMINYERDYFKEKRKKIYSGMITNLGKNCGQIIWEYIRENYFEM